MTEILEIAQPLYVIKHYNDGIYSVCKFKRGCNVIPHHEEEIVDCQEHDGKFDSSFSRARSMVKQYGLCNPWDYFVTLTLDPKKYNRYDLGQFKADLSQFVRDMRKKYKQYGGERLSYVLVPENHKDGAWHMHGLIYGLPEAVTEPFVSGKHPQKLVDGGFLNWTDYERKFGFVSLGKIRDPVGTVLYTTKYINKDIEALADLKGEHLYMASRPLKKAVTVNEVYFPYGELDSIATKEYKFCSVGMVYDKPWYWALQFDADNVPAMFPKSEIAAVPAANVPPYHFDAALIDPTYTQECFF